MICCLGFVWGMIDVNIKEVFGVFGEVVEGMFWSLELFCLGVLNNYKFVLKFCVYDFEFKF